MPPKKKTRKSPTEKPRVIIEVKRGTVVFVGTNKPGTEVTIIDHDNLTEISDTDVFEQAVSPVEIDDSNYNIDEAIIKVCEQYAHYLFNEVEPETGDHD